MFGIALQTSPRRNINEGATPATRICRAVGLSRWRSFGGVADVLAIGGLEVEEDRKPGAKKFEQPEHSAGVADGCDSDRPGTAL